MSLTNDGCVMGYSVELLCCLISDVMEINDEFQHLKLHAKINNKRLNLCFFYSVKLFASVQSQNLNCISLLSVIKAHFLYWFYKRDTSSFKYESNISL